MSCVSFGSVGVHLAALAAENLFLRKQLRPLSGAPGHATTRNQHYARRPGMACRRCFDWRQALTIGEPDTFIRWHRQGFRLFWRWKSRSGRPRLPRELQTLIRQMACDNPTWGQERIANELLLNLGLRASPRTARKDTPKRLDHGRGYRVPSQRWRMFVRNHAQAIIACDFCVVVTATFRLLYVFVLTEHATRRILHVNVKAHPQQLGRCSSCVKRSRRSMATVSSSMTGIAFSLSKLRPEHPPSGPPDL